MLEQGMRTQKGLTEQILAKSRDIQLRDVLIVAVASSSSCCYPLQHCQLAACMIYIAADLGVRHLNNDRSSVTAEMKLFA